MIWSIKRTKNYLASGFLPSFGRRSFKTLAEMLGVMFHDGKIAVSFRGSEGATPCSSNFCWTKTGRSLPFLKFLEPKILVFFFYMGTVLLPCWN